MMNASTNIPRSLLLLILVASTSCAVESQMADASAIGRVGKQHIALMSLAAWYFCENGDWPARIEDLRAYDEGKARGLEFDRDWSYLLSEAVRLRTGPDYELRSTYDISPGVPRTMRSGQQKPKCSPGETELQGSFVRLSAEAVP